MADQTTPRPAMDHRGSSWSDNQPFALMIIITLGVFTSWTLLIFRALPVENHDVLIGMSSAITTVWVAGGAFFFGSSMGNKAKDNVIAGIATQVPTMAAAQPTGATTTTTVVPANTTTTTVVEPAIVAPATKPVEGPGVTLPPTPGETA